MSHFYLFTYLINFKKMKKINFNLFLPALIIVIAITVIVFGTQARINNNDQVVVQSSIEDNIAVHLMLAAETTATSTDLVDLSDTTNYPHYMNAGTMEIAQVRFDYSTETTASTTLKLGVIASSTQAGDYVDIYWFDEISFFADGTETNSRQSKVIDYAPSVMKLNLSGGKPVSFLSNDYSLWTTDYATTSPLKSPAGYGAPGVGDLIMKVYDQKGTATTSVTAIYRIKESQ